MRLRWHLVRLVLAALLPLVALAAVLAWVLVEQDRDSRQRAMRELANNLALSVDTEMQRSISALEVLALSTRLRHGDLDAFRARAESVLSLQPHWSNLLVFDADGAQVMNLRAPSGADLPRLPNIGPVMESVRTGRPAISNVVRGSMTGKHLVYVTVPVVEAGEVRYVLEAAMYSEVWTPWLRERLPDGWIAAIDDRDGYVLGRSEAPERFVGQRATDSVREAYTLNTSGILKAVGLPGIPLYIAYQRAAFTGWHVVVVVPAEIIDAGARWTMLTWVGGSLAVLALAVLLALVTARPLESDIARLGAAIDGLGQGRRPEYRRSAIAEVDAGELAAARAGQLLDERAERVGLLQAELSERVEQAEAANRAKDEFLAMLSHELRNPLAAIANAVAVLKRKEASDEATAMHAILERQTRHLAVLVSDLLDVSRLVTRNLHVRLERVDLGERAAEVVESMRAAGRLAAHDVRVSTSAATVQGDPERLAQIVRNLVDNAVKYTPGGGRIEVSVEAQGDEAVLVVRDNGNGIDPALAARLFEPFVQGRQSLDRPEGGLGLGLAIVKRLVQLHDGTVHVHSDGVGRGAAFEVRLPLTHAPARTTRSRGPRRAPADVCILIVEDHEDTRASLHLLLESQGRRVIEASSGEAGLAALAEHHPEVAIVDLGLPGVDGYAFAREARRCHPRTALVALTGYGQREDREAAMAAGFDAFAVKPASTETIERALRQALEARQGAAVPMSAAGF